MIVAGCGQFSSKDDQSLTISQEEKERRIAIDFNRDSAYIVDYLKGFYPDLTAEQMESWEKSNALECRIINGKKMYFRNAGRNLFRIDTAANAVFDSITTPDPDPLHLFLDTLLRNVIADSRAEHKALVDPVSYKIKFKLTVDADAVPAGELVRAWMPYPREDQDSQTNVELLASSDEYKIAPDNIAHKSIYMEKPAVAGKPTIFTYEISFKCYNEWYDFKPEDVKPYNTESDLYKEYTAERTPHIVFSDRIRHLTDSIVGNETNPFLKVKSIYRWISENYPWASAREYSTIDNIPEYVLDNNHGDCGQVSLLLITMARCAGVPARWQSGWMLHPVEVNLHDWGEIYYEGVGWVPTDMSFGRGRYNVIDNEDEYDFYLHGLDAYRWIVNSDFSGKMFPPKQYTRSETVDFQRGEVEWKGGNLYFDQWNAWIDEISYL